MPVLARTRKGDQVLGGQGSLMVQCLAAGLPVASSCSGRGACAKCVVEVVAGSEGLVPPDSREQLVLLREGLGEGMRLSCQARLARPSTSVTIQTGYW